MPDRSHLEFRRIPRPPSPRRKKKGGWFGVRFEDRSAHAEDIADEADEAVAEFQQRRAAITDFDPKLILKIELGARVAEDEFERAGLRVLDSGDRNVAVVFADDEELERFKARLAEYQQGPREPLAPEGEMRSAAHESFFDSIDHLRPLTPEDRISARLAADLHQAGEGDGFLFDVELWYVADAARREEWLSELREHVEGQDGSVLDEFVSSAAGVSLARCRASAQTVRRVAELDQVAVVDTVPQPRFEPSDIAVLQDLAEIEVTEPPPESPVVGLVDSGVRSGHPLLAPAVVEATALHPEFGGQAEDGHGHGTKVSGITLYGDVARAAQERRFEPEFWIASVRVLDDDCYVPEQASFVRVIREAVEYLAETWECRVINISIGDSESPYSGGKSTPLASTLDALARQYDLAIVVSAGNLFLDDIEELEDPRHAYPRYLTSDGFEILDPSQAALALTVGAISESAGVAGSSGPEIACIADQRGPAPFTRHGPGAQGAIKPELAADGGNLVHDAELQAVRQNVGSAVVSTSGRYPDRLFDGDVGTSLAAPGVAHLAGRLATAYPELSANAIRALLLQGALSQGMSTVLGNEFDGPALEMATLNLCGFGVPTWQRCGLSEDGRVVLYAEDRLRVDDFHVYRLPMTSAYVDTSGPHVMTVALAFSPPVRHRRFDYLAFRMEFLVVRGVSLEQVYEMAATADVDDPGAGSLSDYEAPFRPTRTVRSRGANQVARLESSQRPSKQFRDDWYIVVRSLNKWLGGDADPQPYSLAVCLDAERSDELFIELQQEVEVEVEAEVV